MGLLTRMRKVDPKAAGGDLGEKTSGSRSRLAPMPLADAEEPLSPCLAPNAVKNGRWDGSPRALARVSWLHHSWPFLPISDRGRVRRNVTLS